MGHERVGALPRTRPWRQIVDDLTQAATEPSGDVAQLARKTLDNVRRRYEGLHADIGVQAAFGFLVSLATSHLKPTTGLTSAHCDLSANPSPVRIAQELNSWVDSHTDAPEYAEIARRAGGDAIAQWTHSQTRQPELLEDAAHASIVWARASTGRGFCEVARLFFARFTERYVRYFLEREASASFESVESREHFGRQLTARLADISRHAFETAKITQSFAAGWFNKNARDKRPSDRQLSGFLAVAFGKIQEELHRETLDAP